MLNNRFLFVVSLLLMLRVDVNAQPGDPGGDPDGGGNPTTPSSEAYYVQWTNLVNAQVQSNLLSATAGATGWGSSGAFSSNTIGSTEDGWVETKVTIGSLVMIGLSTNDINTHYNTINYAFYISGNTKKLAVEENGFERINLGTVYEGETLRIRRSGQIIEYVRNGIVVYVSQTPSTGSLGIDLSFGGGGSSLKDVLTSHGVAGQQPADISYDIAWTDATGVAVSGDGLVITKDIAGSWGASGAASVNYLNPNTDGWVDMPVLAGQTNGEIMFGLSDANTDAHFNTIDFAIYISNSIQGAGVYENGTSKISNIPYVVGDRFKVERIGPTIYYKKNDVTFYTSGVSSTTSLVADAAINTQGYKIENAKASFWIPYQQGRVPDHWEFQTLKDVYDSLGGAAWTTKTNWPSVGSWPATATAAQMATWYRVTVTNGDVSALQLYSNNLIGKIPASINKLSQLTVLYLYSNKLNGTIPSSIGDLSKLDYLYLHNNKLVGAVPPELGQLSKLRYLNLSNNLFTGTIPDLSGLASVLSFDVSANTNFTPAPIPSWLTALSNLQTLNLANTKRSGVIPVFLSDMLSLRYLYLNSNQLTGGIPIELGGLNSLIHLYLNTNQLSGSIPNELGNMTSLRQLYLSANQLSGQIPYSLSNIPNLQYLYLAANQFSGSIPEWLGSMGSLLYLNLSNNQFSGSIPESLGNLSNLAYLYLNNNRLGGVLPSSLGSLSNLIYLHIYSNQLTGELPSAWSGMTNLQYFEASANRLTGGIPSTFGALTKMRSFYLNNNLLSGDLPSAIGNWPLLTIFNVNNNKFKSLPAAIKNNPMLNNLNLYNNELTDVPTFADFSNKANLTLDVRNNRLDFSKLEPMVNVGIKSINIVPQKTIADVTYVGVQVNSPMVLTARPLGQFSTIIWRKQNSNGTWSTLSNDEDSNDQTYTRNSFTPQDEGKYMWKTTNSLITGAGIESDPITVKKAKTFALDNWAFQYKYDHRNRMTHKKVPGADWMYMVYDDRDRLVMTQDGEQRKTNKWSFTKYDPLNRPIMTGTYTHTATVDQVAMSALISKVNFSDSYNGSANFHGYSNTVFPTDLTRLDVLTVTYYDNYDFKSTWGGEYDYLPNQVASRTVNGVVYSQPAAAFMQVKGQVTGTKVKTMFPSGDYTVSKWIQAISYYDDRYRLIQYVSENGTGGVDNTTNTYDFLGRLLSSKVIHGGKGFVSWRDITTGVSLSGLRIYRSAGGSDWTNGAASLEVLPANKDGWFEYTHSNANNMIVGFSDANLDTQPTSIDFGMSNGSTTLSAYQNGSSIGVIAPLAIGDVIRMERVGNSIRVRRNGALVYTFPTQTTSALLVDVSFFSGQSSLVFTRASFAGITTSTTRTFDYDHAGRLVNTWHMVGGGQVPWDGLANVTDFGDKIGKTSGAVNVWDGVATSSPILEPGQDGWIDARVETLSQSRYGFEVLDEANSVVNSYHIRVSSIGSNIIIYKDGNVITYNGGIVNAGDRIKVERKGTLILCKINDATKYTFSGVDNNKRIRASAMFLHANQHFLYDTRFGVPNVLLAHNEYNELGQLVDKKLHSTDNGTTFKQSTDYRYNIRGWLTSVNNADLNVNPVNNDDTNDLFGMELAYNEALGTGNASLYNGNISGMKWSRNQGVGGVKANAYNYIYDPMNRLKSASFHQLTGVWASTSAFSVSGINYDLNGNINSLTRKGKNGSDQDILSYDYGVNETRGNQLRWVSDAGDAIKGFADGNLSGDDYLYDANGNMIADKNKNITAITYNHLNLPEKVTKGTGEYIKYTYDATGKKLSQQVYEANNVLKKTTDYVNEYVYENDTQDDPYSHSVIHQSDFSSGNAGWYGTGASVTGNVDGVGNKNDVLQFSTVSAANNQHYAVKDDLVPVPGKKYTLYAEFFIPSSNTVFNGFGITNSSGSQMLLDARNLVRDTWVQLESSVIEYSSGNRFVLRAYNGTSLILSSNAELGYMVNFSISEKELLPEVPSFINTEEGRIVFEEGLPVYQYHLKDHLGNVRVTFTTKDEQETNKATLETAAAVEERGQFLYYDDVRLVNSILFDKTKDGQGTPPEGAYAQRLNGTANERTGLAKSLAVVPGDKVQLEVYAKYVDPNSTNWTAALTNLLTSVANGTAAPGTVIDGAGYAYGGTNAFPFGGLLDKTNETGTGPKAFLNYLVFDSDYLPVLAKSGYKRLSDAPKETGTNVAHEKLDWEIDITEPGYVYIWLSNDEVALGGSPIEVYFDDFKVTHVKSPVIQSDEYYPFGLTFNSYTRENATKNNYLYNGKELEPEIGWYNYGSRMLDPTIGRWNGTDAYSDVYEDLSPYNYALNNPIRVIDSDGNLVVYVNGFRVNAYTKYINDRSIESTSYGTHGMYPEAKEPWNHDQRFYNQDVYRYWNQFDINFWNGTEQRLYVDGMFHPKSNGSSRFDRGREEGKLLAEKIRSGEITIEDGEVIKLVGHSHGGAHAMGMAQGLLDGGIDQSLISVFLFATHQPNQTPGVDVKVYQFSRKGDKVSSKGKIANQLGSTFTAIDGANFNQMPDGNDDGLGNHGVQTYTTEEFKEANPKLYQWLIDQGIINEDGSLNDNQ